MENRIIAVLFLAISAIEQGQQPAHQGWYDWAKGGINKAYEYLPSWHYLPAIGAGFATPILYKMGYNDYLSGAIAGGLTGGLLGAAYGLKNPGITKDLVLNRYMAPGVAATLTMTPYGLWRAYNGAHDPIALGSMMAGPAMIVMGTILRWYARPLEDINALVRDLNSNPSERELAKYINPLTVTAALCLATGGLELLLGYLEQRLTTGTLNAEAVSAIANGPELGMGYRDLDPLAVVVSIAALAVGGLPFMGARLAMLASKFPIASHVVLDPIKNQIAAAAVRTGAPINMATLTQRLRNVVPKRIPSGAYNAAPFRR